jgi:protein-disulfide isomerase
MNTNIPYAPTPLPVKAKGYKVWAIAATIFSVILAIAVAVLVTLVVVDHKNADSVSDQAEISAETDGDDVTLAQPAEVDISALDDAKLITAADLQAGEIPDHYLGNKNAKVVVIEYEDFACSHCQALHKDAAQIHADYQNRVLFIHRGFSLGFPNSDKTLSAAEAAYEVGGEKAYWAMTELLYKDAKWTGNEVFGGQGILNSYAKQIGLNVSEFKKAMSSVAVANKIVRDKELGLRADVVGTPTWFINGAQVTALDADLRAAIDAALL